MISFTLCLAALIIFYFVYGKFVEKIFQPDNRKTPAFTKCDTWTSCHFPHGKYL